MKKTLNLIIILLFVALTGHGMTWSGDAGPWGTDPMDECVLTWNTYADYAINFNVYYNAGIPTAQSDYMGSIGFGGMGNYRTCMHESSHYLGTGTYWEWYGMNHFRRGVWNGTYAYNLSCAYNGPGARQSGDSQHYWPYGANYDSEGVDAPRMVGIIGAYRRDMGLDDQTIGIASGTYRLQSRVSALTLDSRSVTAEGAPVIQNRTLTGENNQLWNIDLQEGTIYFTIQNAANGLYLDSMGGANDDPVGMTALSGSPTDNQLWSIEQTDSFYFKIVNKGNGRGIDSYGSLDAGDDMLQYAAAGNGNWNMQWTFKHQNAQVSPEAGVISQGRIVSTSSYGGGLEPENGNNGCSADRWTASDGAYPQWWNVDLGSVQPISKVEVDWFPGGVFQYTIYVSDDNVSWTAVADRSSNTESGTTVDTLTGVSGRYVSVNISGTTTGGWAAFMECRVYNESQNQQLLSLNRPCSASSEQLGNLAVNANNVDPYFTRWCANGSGYDAWWQVDLGSAQQVSRAVIQWFDDDSRYYQYRVEGSLDGVNYTTLSDSTANTTVGTTSDALSGTWRYVRVYVTGGNAGWPSMYDCQIYGVSSVEGAGVPPAAPAGLTGSVGDGSVLLDWADNRESDFATYTVYRSTTSGSGYVAIASNLTESTYGDDSVEGDTLYCYVVTAVDAEANESGLSREAAVITASTLALWDFNDPSLGASEGVAVPDSDGYAVWREAAADKSGNGNDLTTWEYAWAGFNWSTNSRQGDFSIKSQGDYPAAFTWSSQSAPGGTDIETFTGSSFTVEALATISGSNAWRTVVGRDARNLSTGDGERAALYLGLDRQNHARFQYTDVNGNTADLYSTTTYSADGSVFHHFVGTTDGSTVSLYVDGELVAQATGQSLAGLGIGSTSEGGYHAGGWSIGRGLYAGGHGDRWFGYIDAVAISSTMLNTNSFVLSQSDAPAAPTGLFVTAGDGAVDINWADNSEPDLDSYTVYRSTTSGTNFTSVASGLTNSAYTDNTVTNGTTYYYVVTAFDTDANESGASSEASATLSPDVVPEEYYIAGNAVIGGTNLALTVSNSVTGHRYYLLSTDTLTPPAWTTNTFEAGTGSNLMFDISIDPASTNRYYKLDVQRQ